MKVRVRHMAAVAALSGASIFAGGCASSVQDHPVTFSASDADPLPVAMLNTLGSSPSASAAHGPTSAPPTRRVASSGGSC